MACEQPRNRMSLFCLKLLDKKSCYLFKVSECCVISNISEFNLQKKSEKNKQRKKTKQKEFYPECSLVSDH